MEDDKEKPIIIKEMDDFLKFYDDLVLTNKSKYIYRGQSNKNGEIWKLNSSLRRYFLNVIDIDDSSLINQEWIYMDFLQRNKELISTFSKKSSKEKPDLLEILSNLQHSGSPTILIDFTNSLDVALWFSFHEVNDFNQNANKGNVSFVTIFYKEYEEKDIQYKLSEDLFKPNTLYGSLPPLFSCPHNNYRGVAQRSLFIVDSMNKLENNFFKMYIAHELKKDIIDFLDRKGINTEVLFPDNEGISKRFLDEDKLTLFLKFKNLVYGEKFSSNDLITISEHKETWELEKESKIELNYLIGKVHSNDYKLYLENKLIKTSNELIESKYLRDAIYNFNKQIKVNLNASERGAFYSISSYLEINKLILMVWRKLFEEYENGNWSLTQINLDIKEGIAKIFKSKKDGALLILDNVLIENYIRMIKLWLKKLKTEKKKSVDSIWRDIYEAIVLVDEEHKKMLKWFEEINKEEENV